MSVISTLYGCAAFCNSQEGSEDSVMRILDDAGTGSTCNPISVLQGSAAVVSPALRPLVQGVMLILIDFVRRPQGVVTCSCIEADKAPELAVVVRPVE